MKGKDIRQAINHIDAIEKLSVCDYEDDINDLVCYRDDKRGFGFKEIETMPDYKDERVIRYIANHLLALSEIFTEYTEKIDGIVEKIRKENQISEDTAGDIEDLTDEITRRIDDIDVPESEKGKGADKAETGKIEITYEVYTCDRLARTIKDVAEELGYVCDNEQLKEVYSSIVENILDRYLDLEYLDTDTISDLVIDYFTKEADA
ncbi:MAG: hypothetical protein ACYCSB_01310 [bacterium]|jgi:hypothetical protein